MKSVMGKKLANPPVLKRESTYLVAVGLATAFVAEFPHYAEQILPFVRDDWKPGLHFAAITCGFLAILFLRAGLTRVDTKAEVIARHVTSGGEEPLEPKQ